MQRSGRQLVVVIAACLIACSEERPSYHVTMGRDSVTVSSEILELRLDEVVGGVERVEADVFLNGDLTEEQAILSLEQTLDSLWTAYPRATIIRAIGFMLNFAEARGERVPLDPVVLGERHPVARDTLAVRRPSDVYRNHVTVIGALPTQDP